MDTDTKKKIAQRIAKAITLLDGASFRATGTPFHDRIRFNRAGLFDTMLELGYEFSQNDSARIRKVLKIETAASILADMNRKQQAENKFVNISPAQLRRKTLKAMSKCL